MSALAIDILLRPEHNIQEGFVVCEQSCRAAFYRINEVMTGAEIRGEQLAVVCAVSYLCAGEFFLEKKPSGNQSLPSFCSITAAPTAVPEASMLSRSWAFGFG